MTWTYTWPAIIAVAFLAVAFVSFIWNLNERLKREEAEQRKRDLDEILAKHDKSTRP